MSIPDVTRISAPRVSPMFVDDDQGSTQAPRAGNKGRIYGIQGPFAAGPVRYCKDTNLGFIWLCGDQLDLAKRKPPGIVMHSNARETRMVQAVQPDGLEL